MSAPLSAEEQAEYTPIIDEILHVSDLESVSRKVIMRGLEEKVGKDLREQKQALKLLIAARFDAIATANNNTPPADVKEETNGHTPPDSQQSAEDDADADENPDYSDAANSENETKPAKKKQKRESSEDEDADARLAAELQAQEEALARGRTTRGAGTKGAKKKKPVKKAKSAKRVRDDSDGEGSGSEDGEKKKRKAGGGFQKPFNLSYPLVELVGAEQLSRPQVVKKLWEHIKGNNLQNPENKRQILCDAKMEAVFKTDKLDMFQMNKLLGNHLYPIEAEAE